MQPGDEIMHIDDIIKIAETVDKYGMFVVVGAVFIVITLLAFFLIFSRFMKQSKNSDTSYQKLLAEQAAQNQAVFEKLMTSAFDRRSADNQDLIKEGIDTSKVIDGHLKYAGAISKCDRVAVYVFHNGERMLNGRHLLKFSCLSEFVSLAKFSKIDKHKAMPINVIQEGCDSLLEYHSWEFISKDALTDPTMIAWVESQCDCQSSFAYAIYDSNGAIIGFVVLEYIIDPVDSDRIEQAREEVKRLSDRVTVAVDLNLIERRGAV